jgi:hypothetical protein
MPRKKKPSAASAAKGTKAYAAAAAAASDEAAPDEAARGETLHTHRPTGSMAGVNPASRRVGIGLGLAEEPPLSGRSLCSVVQA